ncbi:hypothetical protein D9M68_818720 [compost metagenome]
MPVIGGGLKDSTMASFCPAPMAMKLWVRLRASSSGVVRSLQSFSGTKDTPALLRVPKVRMSKPAKVTTSCTAGCFINCSLTAPVTSSVRVSEAAGGRK